MLKSLAFSKSIASACYADATGQLGRETFCSYTTIWIKTKVNSMVAWNLGRFIERKHKMMGLVMWVGK